MPSDTKTEAPSIYPTFRYRDPAAMIDFLCRAFGFRVRAKYGEGDDVHHAELELGSSIIMLGGVRDDEYGAMVGQPGENGGQSVYIAMRDADTLHAQAKAAGAKILREPYDTGHGSRDFICRDPEGNVWCFGTYWPKAGEKPL
ncbi:MAG: VOC family protein [Hyphomicrobiales bacterium]|nr:VOC family protein [Hyphomicrobiales bacterium]